MNKKDVQEEIMQKWEEITKLFKQFYDVNYDRLNIKLDQHKIPQLTISKKKTREKTNDFEIHFIDRNITLSSKEMNASDILKRFIQLVDIEKVKALNLITVNGRDLITDTNELGENRHQLDGKYLFIKTGTHEKINTIRMIINGLNINAQIIDL